MAAVVTGGTVLPLSVIPDDPFTLRQADQARTDFAIIEAELEVDPRPVCTSPRPWHARPRQSLFRALIAMEGLDVVAAKLQS